VTKPDAVFVNDHPFYFRVTVLVGVDTERVSNTLGCQLQTYATGRLRITYRLPSVYLSRVCRL